MNQAETSGFEQLTRRVLVRSKRYAVQANCLCASTSCIREHVCFEQLNTSNDRIPHVKGPRSSIIHLPVLQRHPSISLLVIQDGRSSTPIFRVFIRSIFLPTLSSTSTPIPPTHPTQLKPHHQAPLTHARLPPCVAALKLATTATNT